MPSLKTFLHRQTKSLLLLLAAICSFVAPKLFASDCQSEACAEQGKLTLSVALGAGIRTNPLRTGDNFPLIIVPDIAWYGEHFYIDNTEAGYQWQNQDNFAFETFLSLNRERGYFSRSHASNFFLASSAPGTALTEDSESSDFSPAVPGEDFSMQQSRAPGIDDIARRDWAIDAGIRFHWYWEASELSLTALQDISSVHQGQQLTVAFNRTTMWGKWRVNGTLGLTWKSKQLLNYYYGIDTKDEVSSHWFYHADSGIFPSVKLSASRPITENWQFFTHIKYTHLDNAMTRSPLVDKNKTITLFGGVTYRF